MEEFEVTKTEDSSIVRARRARSRQGALELTGAQDLLQIFGVDMTTNGSWAWATVTEIAFAVSKS